MVRRKSVYALKTEVAQAETASGLAQIFCYCTKVVFQYFTQVFFEYFLLSVLLIPPISALMDHTLTRDESSPVGVSINAVE